MQLSQGFTKLLTHLHTYNHCNHLGRVQPLGMERETINGFFKCKQGLDFTSSHIQYVLSQAVDKELINMIFTGALQ